MRALILLCVAMAPSQLQHSICRRNALTHTHLRFTHLSCGSGTQVKHELPHLTVFGMMLTLPAVSAASAAILSCMIQPESEDMVVT